MPVRAHIRRITTDAGEVEIDGLDASDLPDLQEWLRENGPTLDLDPQTIEYEVESVEIIE